MITDFDLQAQSGQLWPQIKERLDALAAERDALAAELTDLRKLWDARDIAGIAAHVAENDKSAAQKALDAADADVLAAQKRRDDLAKSF